MLGYGCVLKHPFVVGYFLDYLGKMNGSKGLVVVFWTAFLERVLFVRICSQKTSTKLRFWWKLKLTKTESHQTNKGICHIRDEGFFFGQISIRLRVVSLHRGENPPMN